MYAKSKFVTVLFVSFLFIGVLGPVLNVWQIKPVQAATGSFGNTATAGTWWSGTNLFVGCKFTLAEDANLVSISAWGYDGAYGAKYKYGVYDTSFNYLGTTAEGTYLGAYGWVWFNQTISGTVALVAADYYLCMFTENGYVAYDSGSTNQAFSFTTTYGSWPSSLTPTTQYDRSIEIYANYTDYAPPPPTYSTPTTNSSKAGQPCNFSIAANSGGGGLTNAFLESNNTGTVANDTYSFSYATETANITKTLNSTVGNVVQYKWFINGTTGGFNTTGLYNLTITSYINFTSFSLANVNSTRAGDGITYSIKAYTDETFSGFIFESNNTGTPTNTTWTSLTGSNLYINATGTLNDTIVVVSYAFYVNTTVNLWNSSGFYNITTENDAMWLHTDGVHLKDEAGNEIFLRGIHKTGFDDEPNGWWSPEGSNQGGNGVWSETAVKANLDAMKMWGANVVRLLIRVCWWINDTDNNRQHIKDVCTWAKERGMYVEYCFYLIRNTVGGQIDMPYPPYVNAGDEEFIANEQEFADFWGNFSSEMKSYDNIFYWLFGEPISDTDQNWWDVQQNAINQIRGNETGGVPHIAVVSRNSGVWCNIETNATGTGVEWVANAKGNITDRFNSMIYGTDFYRVYAGTGLFNNYTTGWTYTHIMSALQIEQFDWVHDTLQVPFIIGEFGLDLGASDMAQEQEAWNATIYAFNYYEMNYCPLWWRTEYAWSLFSGNIYIPKPNYAGMMFIAAMHSTPFVFSCGDTFVSGISNYYIYGNNTTWSNTWLSNQLNITYTGSTQVRVFWNVSDTYPVNSTLHCVNSNNTKFNATDLFDSTISMIRLNSSASGSWLIGYNLIETIAVTVTNPTATTYNTGTISVELSASGGTIDQLWYNCKNASTWIYPSNLTYTVATSMTGFINGTYTFYAWGNNTSGAEDEETVAFTVTVYDVEITVTAPTATTYNSRTITVTFSAVGGTIDQLWYNCKNTSSWIYGSNQTYSGATSMSGFVNGSSYTFYAWANNTLGDEDETTVAFSVTVYTVEVTITNPTATTYSASSFSVEFSAVGGTMDQYWWNVKNGSSWVYASNNTYTLPASPTGFSDGSYTFYGFANNTLGTESYTTVSFTIAIAPTSEGSPQSSSSQTILFKVTLNGNPLENCQIRIVTTTYQDYIGTYMTDEQGKATAYLTVGTYDYRATYQTYEVSDTIQHIEEETITLKLGTEASTETRTMPTLDRTQIMKIGIALIICVGAVFAITTVAKKRRW